MSLVILYLIGMGVFLVACGYYMKKHDDPAFLGVAVIASLIWPLAVFMIVCLLAGKNIADQRRRREMPQTIHPHTLDHSPETLRRLSKLARELSHDEMTGNFDDLQDIANLLLDWAALRDGMALIDINGDPYPKPVT